MPIVSITSDAPSLTLTCIGEYPVTVERLWQAYSDPRQLERFWGPQEWPAKFTRHDFTVGGQANYTMTGPDGTQSSGWWRFLRIEHARLIEIEDGFAAPDGTPNTAMPSMRMSFSFEPAATGARVVSVTRFTSLESMEQLVQMGMLEGVRSAMGQLDAVLAEPGS
jgi:uncharacterized protein YndB with AHSA1/START domain